MNGGPPDEPTNPIDTPRIARIDVTTEEWIFYWVKRLLICNPFYLASAALLLYGIAKRAESPDFPNETSQLFFNFGSLQFYELLLVGTAIVLSRRRVWYDSTLLVFLA